VTEDPKNDLPLKFRVLVIGALAVTLIAHIFVDAFNKSYEGASVSLMLGGVVGTALGVNEYLRGRGGG
jgi:Ca2+/H+ antiporter